MLTTEKRLGRTFNNITRICHVAKHLALTNLKRNLQVVEERFESQSVIASFFLLDSMASLQDLTKDVAALE